MKILLTHGYFLADDPKEQAIMRPYPPLGILYLNAYLKRKGIASEVFDTTFATKQSLKEYLLQARPDFVGLYVNLMTKLNILEIMKFIRSEERLKHTRIILGGPEVKHHDEAFLRAGADFIVLGEGETTLYDLLTTVDSAFSPFLDTIDGIAFINVKGEVVRTKEREKIKDIDILPMPDRKAIDLNKYFAAWKERHGYSTASVSTMRGCPYTCKWCSRAVYGLSYRRRSAKLVVEELAWMQQNYQVDGFWFVDDVFTISHKWLAAFAEELMLKGIEIRYECITRADRMNEEVVALLEQTGCFRVWIGAESGSQRVIDLMDRRVHVNQVRDMIHLSQAHGIEAGTFIMLGYPGETEQDIEETVEHLIASDPDLFTITVAYPIKGTPMYEEVESQILEKLPWESSTDRDLDFKRTYNRKYYDYAVRYVVNKVNSAKARKRKKTIESWKLGLKAWVAKRRMKAEA
jgi:anaerobic magnesium-protoporphyrin IX monomethyl ester cyclase